MDRHIASICIRTVISLAVIGAVSGALTACQMLTGYQTIATPKAPTAPVGSIYSQPGEVSIACEGTYHCEIAQIDKQRLISTENHQPLNEAMVTSADKVFRNSEKHAKTIKLVALMPTKLQGLMNYYARVIPGKREVHVNFYPENNDAYVEHFALIHEFTEPGDYRLHAYRIASTNTATSLLNSASPNPLCVELLQDKRPIRRFCKLPLDTRQNEFIEVTDIKNGADLEAFLSSDGSGFDNDAVK